MHLRHPPRWMCSAFPSLCTNCSIETCCCTRWPWPAGGWEGGLLGRGVCMLLFSVAMTGRWVAGWLRPGACRAHISQVVGFKPLFLAIYREARVGSVNSALRSADASCQAAQCSQMRCNLPYHPACWVHGVNKNVLLMTDCAQGRGCGGLCRARGGRVPAPNRPEASTGAECPHRGCLVTRPAAQVGLIGYLRGGGMPMTRRCRP